METRGNYVTLRWVESRNACMQSVTDFRAEFGEKATVKEVYDWIIRIGKLGWLVWLINQDDLKISKELIELGADDHANNENALRWAARMGHLETVELFVKKGVDFRFNKDCILWWAAYSGHLRIVKFLVESGANARANKDLALYWAKRMGHPEVVKFLGG